LLQDWRAAHAQDDATTKLAIIYYSATGHGTTMAKCIAAANYGATKDLPVATGDDIVWADVVIFGSPTRFGSPASQLRNFLDSLAGCGPKVNSPTKCMRASPRLTPYTAARRPPGPVRGSGRRPGHLLNLTATPRYRDDLLKNAPIKSISTNRGSGCFGVPHRLLHLK
jgi:hypothetical protein